MKSGIGMKHSLALSVLIHAALVAALLLIGSAATLERDVFYVELKSITMSPPPKGAPDAQPAEKPVPQPPQKIAKPEKKKPEEVKPPVVEQQPVEAPESSESFVVESPGEESTVESISTSVAYSATMDYAGGDVSRGASSGVEGAAPSSGPQVSRDALLLQIREAIQRELTYPPIARKRRIEGTVVAGFTIDRVGRPQGIEIVESSGFSVLDKEVVKIIQRAAPFPHMPERVEVPVSFRLVTER